MPARVLVAKPGLDGHGRVARALRDAGFEVVYTGIHRRVEEIVSIAVAEDVAVAGLREADTAAVFFTRTPLDRLVTEIRALTGPATPAPESR